MEKKILHKAIKHLKQDKTLGRQVSRSKNILSEFGNRRPSDPFQSLVRSIVYQQLSGKAAGTILARFIALFPKGKFPTPKQVLKMPDKKLRSAGLSGQKTRYLKDLAKRFLDGTITPKHFPKMSDEEIREHLLVVKGVGRWTADMFLMFTLYRPDVLATGDLGIQKGFQKLFKLRGLPSPEHMERLALPWAPYRTVASWYLWQAVDNADADW